MLAKDLLLAQDVCLAKAATGRRQRDITRFDVGETQQVGGLGKREQIVGVQLQVARQLIQVLAVTQLVQSFDKAVSSPILTCGSD